MNSNYKRNEMYVFIGKRVYMDIKRLNDNQIRCALTETEIEEMGFSIDEIIGNGETTQKFMRVVLEKVEEQEEIDTELLSPMVRAELLPDHSMAITFGGISEEEKQDMFGKLLEMVNQMTGKAQNALQKEKEKAAADMSVFEAKAEDTGEEEIFTESVLLAVEFGSIADAVRISKTFAGKAKLSQSSFYKTEGKYYLTIDCKGFSKQEIKPMVFMAVEYGYRWIAAPMEIAYIKEHGKCIMPQEAVSALMQL